MHKYQNLDLFQELLFLLKLYSSSVSSSSSSCSVSLDPINSINLGWQRKKNLDLWRTFDRYYEQAKRFCNNINFKWVKGHNTSVYNNIADKLAVEAYLDYYEG